METTHCIEAAAVRLGIHSSHSFISPASTPIIFDDWVPKSTRWEEIAPGCALVFHLPLNDSMTIATTATIPTSDTTTCITSATAAAILV